MRSFKSILVVLLAVIWLPATMHCGLETIPGLQFLACESETAEKSKSDCSDDDCCSVEKSLYKTEQHRFANLLPEFQPLSLTSVFELASALPDQASREAFAVVRPELPKCWQFVFRTASPPRAPSFAS